MTKSEIIEKLKSCRTFREAGVTITDVISVLSDESGNNKCDGACQEEIKKLNDKIMRLSEANKQLRAENKQLKMGG